MFIVGISGKRGSGKSLLAKKLKYWGFKEVSLAFKLKQMAQSAFGLTLEQVNGGSKEEPILTLPARYIGTNGHDFNLLHWTPRDILIEMGKFYRTIDPDFWIKAAYDDMMSLEDHLEDSLTFVIPDVRFKNEADWIKQKGGMLVRLNRSSDLNVYKEPINDPTETDLDDYTHWDLLVPESSNKTPEDLEDLAKSIHEIYLARHQTLN